LGEEKTFQQKLFRFLVSRAAGIVTLSEKEAEKLQKRFPKLAEKITFIPFGVDLDFFKPSEVTEELRLIAIGTDPDRDYKTLFAACEGLNIPLTVTTRPNRLTAFNPLPAFVTVKSFSPRELVDAYNRSAIAIIPLDTSSRLNDAMGGSTVQESLAMGKAIIASHTFTMESYIFPEKNGLLVKERDVSQLRAAIQRLIADPVLRAHFGKNARTFAEDHLEIHACTKRLADFFKSL
jgi:glycosyltransferase involved in cell wall biosynthesis